MCGCDAATATTIYERDSEGFLLLVCSLLAHWVARAASDQKNSSLGVEQINYDTIDRRWRQKGEDLRKQALERFESTEFSAGVAAFSVEYKTRDRFGFPRVSH